MNKAFLFVALLLIAISVKEIYSNETMKSITTSFLKVLDECKHELNLGDNVLGDLYHFWKQDHALLHRDTGCAIVCMSKKLNLLDTSGKLHHGKAQEFALNHGAASEMASKLVAVVHECERKVDAEEDPCVRALEIAKCFKDAMHEINWAPKMDVIITEVLTEI
ncbi:pheromone-binding protein-like [Maniola hyperantus]|uniref:pheromone-binding protein-like n=1 Tax=Aphantopus hyperantus TaxID=2795564 RepID=UPI00156857AF|nr:pheromone-binding protein-like [Maniola hyperantus]